MRRAMDGTGGGCEIQFLKGGWAVKGCQFGLNCKGLMSVVLELLGDFGISEMIIIMCMLNIRRPVFCGYVCTRA